MRIAVLGAGAWGTALALTFCHRHEVTLWARNSKKLCALARSRINKRYLPGFVLPRELRLEPDLAGAVNSADLLLAVVPSSGLRETLKRINQSGTKPPVIWACKGFEAVSAKLPHEVAAEELGEDYRCGVLSGPSFAEEVARGLPTAVTLASGDASFAAATAKALHDNRFRVYSSDDVIGVEVAGAVKNVLAIATGICDGMGFGLNTRAALLTRGLAEISRLALALDGRMETLMGLGGMGDLILTCTGDLSRNRRVGLMLAKGHELAGILKALRHVAEGVNSAGEVRRLAQRLNVEMPISEAVCRVLYDSVSPKTAVEELLSREPKAETPR